MDFVVSGDDSLYIVFCFLFILLKKAVVFISNFIPDMGILPTGVGYILLLELSSQLKTCCTIEVRVGRILKTQDDAVQIQL